MTHRHQQQPQHRQGCNPKKRSFCSASAAQQRSNVGFVSADGQFERCAAVTAGRRLGGKHENNTTHTNQNQQQLLNINAHQSVAFTSALPAISSWQAAG
jgi:hypothetical protein